MNNKGFTLVEVLVSLALVSVIAIFLFQIIFIVRDIYAEKNIKSEIYIESANISNVINISFKFGDFECYRLVELKNLFQKYFFVK